MDEALNHYLRALSDPDIPVSISDVERLIGEYPFFTLPALTLMKREGKSLPADMRREPMAKAALNAPDPKAFAIMTDPDCDTWQNFYPREEKPKVSTNDAIDTFLATYGHSSEKEDELLERLIFNPAADYSVILAREEEESLPEAPSPADNSQEALINSFILKSKAGGSLKFRHEEPAVPEVSGEEIAAGVASGPLAEPEDSTVLSEEVQPMKPDDHPVAVADSADGSSLSESLAKIYIRRQRYDKAFEIIHNLSLKNPKKSVYFADQLRFLRKLMLNSQFKKQI